MSELINAGLIGSALGKASGTTCLNGATYNGLLTSGWKTANSENWTVLAGGGDTFVGAGDVSVSIAPATDDQLTIAQSSSCGITQNGDCRFRFPSPTLGANAQVDIQAWLITQDGQNGFGVILTNNVAKTLYDIQLMRVDAGVPTVITSGSTVSYSDTNGLQVELITIEGVQYLRSMYWSNSGGNWINLTSPSNYEIDPKNSIILYPVVILSRSATSSANAITAHINSIETSNDASLT